MRDYELVVVSYRSRDQVEQMLAGLPGDVPLVIVDNAGNADRLREWVAGRPQARYVDGGGRGFAHAVNAGVRSSQRDIVICVNPDARPTLGVLEALASDVRDDPRCASSAALTVDANGTPEMGNGGWEPSFARAVAHTVGLHKLAPRSGIWARPARGEVITLGWTTAACMASRRSTFAALGGFDEGFYVYCEDIAFGRTVRENGLYQRLRTDLVVEHDNGGSGAPSLEMMQLRGAMLARYLRAQHGRGASVAVAETLAAGFVARSVQQRLKGNAAMAQQHRAYARGLHTGQAFVAGKDVIPSLQEPGGRQDFGEPSTASAS